MKAGGAGNFKFKGFFEISPRTTTVTRQKTAILAGYWILKFADDTKIFCRVSDPEDCINLQRLG